MELLEINNSNINLLLEKFGKKLDGKGFIIDKKTKERESCKYTGEVLTKNNLGGILPGSNIFIVDSDVAYAQYIMEFLAKDE